MSRRQKMLSQSDVRESTVEVKSDRRAVAGTVAFTSGLNPHDGVDGGESGIEGWVGSEAGVFDVAPVAPLAAEVLLPRSALVHNEVVGEPCASQRRTECLKQS